MSVYSGFATRQLESAYNQSLYKVLQLMQKQLLELLKLVEVDLSNWGFAFSRQHKVLKSLEKQKYLKPNFSQAVSDLDNYIKTNCDFKSTKNSFESINHSYVDLHFFDEALAYDSSRGPNIGQPKIGRTISKSFKPAPARAGKSVSPPKKRSTIRYKRFGRASDFYQKRAYEQLMTNNSNKT